jgi:hypothetical protein
LPFGVSRLSRAVGSPIDISTITRSRPRCRSLDEGKASSRWSTSYGEPLRSLCS